MKKLMIAAAIVCAAAMSQAATYEWNASGSAYWAETDDGHEFGGYSIYAFDASKYQYTAIAESLANGDLTVLGNSLGNGQINEYAEFAFASSDSGAKKIESYGEKPNEYAKAFLVLLSDAQTDGKQYFTTKQLAEVPITSAVETGGVPIKSTWVIDTLPGGADWQAVSVPEPTSGLLLLLGMAGLALRRRRV